MKNVNNFASLFWGITTRLSGCGLGSMLDQLVIFICVYPYLVFCFMISVILFVYLWYCCDLVSGVFFILLFLDLFDFVPFCCLKV